MDALKAAIKREGINEENALDDKLDPELLSFDHKRCADCSYGYAMACDCMSHLTALQKQVHDANKRLQSLVEIRERMREAFEAVLAANDTSASVNSNGNERPSDKI
jgi:hypothetical protein